MRITNRHKAMPAHSRPLLVSLLGVAMLVTAGCNSERDDSDGVVINDIVLDPDVVLGLYCEDVGISPETCVLDDPANPFANTTIFEFNEDDPDGPSKFDIADNLPAGPAGAKSRFYFWATALARRPNGENQYYTALALHELFSANSNALGEDELIRTQALKAYRSVLDNFFASALVFKCFLCGEQPVLDEFGQPVLDDNGDPVIDFPQFAFPLNERVADVLFRTLATASPSYPDGLRRLVPTEIGVLNLFVTWGYSYQPCTDAPACTNGVVAPAEF